MWFVYTHDHIHTYVRYMCLCISVHGMRIPMLLRAPCSFSPEQQSDEVNSSCSVSFSTPWLTQKARCLRRALLDSSVRLLRSEMVHVSEVGAQTGILPSLSIYAHTNFRTKAYIMKVIIMASCMQYYI